MVDRVANWYMGLPETWILMAICAMLFVLVAPVQVTAWALGGLLFLYWTLKTS